ncbi:hypothetical protein ACX3T8_07290, partial [Corynebacterium pyruviciproducens]
LRARDHLTKRSVPNLTIMPEHVRTCAAGDQCAAAHFFHHRTSARPRTHQRPTVIVFAQRRTTHIL